MVHERTTAENGGADRGSQREGAQAGDVDPRLRRSRTRIGRGLNACAARALGAVSWLLRLVAVEFEREARRVDRAALRRYCRALGHEEVMRALNQRPKS